MFIHIGGATMVRLSDVIGIFDMTAMENTDTQHYLDLAKRANSVEVVDIGEMKSFIVTNKRVYYSPISSLTLKKRAGILQHTESDFTEPHHS